MTRPIRIARPGLGAEFFDAVLKALDRITENPEFGAAALGAVEARRAFVAGFPYQVVYRLGINDIRILAFAHFKRRPGFWQRRR